MPEYLLSESLFCDQVFPANVLLFYVDQRLFQC